jgi:hypothetical protein
VEGLKNNYLQKVNSYQTFLSEANSQIKNHERKNNQWTNNTSLKLKNSILNHKEAQRKKENPQQPSNSRTKASNDQ